MAVTLQEIRKEIWDCLDPEAKDYLRVSDIDQYINDTIRDLVRDGEALVDSAVCASINDQERYDLTSALIWISDDNKTDTATDVNDADFTSSDTTFTVDDGTKLVNNSYIKIDDEIMKVTTIATNLITVARGLAGTTAVSHDDDSDVYESASLNVLKIQRVDYDGSKIEKGSIENINRLDVT